MTLDWATICTWGLTSSTLSGVAGILVLVLVRYNRKLNTFWNRIICQFALQSILGFFIAVPTFSGFVAGTDYQLNDTLGCEIQAFTVQWIYSVSMYLKLVLVTSMYFKICRGVDPAKYERYICVFVWGWPFAVACVVAVLPDVPYGPAGPWCWITSEAPVARLIVFYAWVWIAFLFIIAGVVQMARSVSKSLAETSRVRSSSAHRSVQIKRRLFRQLSLYLVIFVIVWLPGTINRILEAVKSPLLASEGNFFFSFHLFFVSSGGWMNLIIFTTVNQKTSSHLMRHLWRRIARQCRRRKNRLPFPTDSPIMRPMVADSSTASEMPSEGPEAIPEEPATEKGGGDSQKKGQSTTNPLIAMQETGEAKEAVAQQARASSASQ